MEEVDIDRNLNQRLAWHLWCNPNVLPPEHASLVNETEIDGFAIIQEWDSDKMIIG